MIDSVDLECVAQEIEWKTGRKLVLDLAENTSKTLRKMERCEHSGTWVKKVSNHMGYTFVDLSSSLAVGRLVGSLEGRPTFVRSAWPR